MKSKKKYKARIKGITAPSASRILRFRKSERHVHWAIAIPFMVCYATALILIFLYNHNPERAYRDIFSWAHRISGICLIVLPAVSIVTSKKGDWKMYYYNIKQAWTWTLEDIKWLALMGLAAVYKKIKLPEQGKFNAAEKINFMTLMSTYPLYILTGLLIWLTDGAFLAWLVHFGMAIIATPLMLGHIFMATINPGTRPGLSGMISGFVDRQWAKHHYARWYREHWEADHVFTPISNDPPHTNEQHSPPVIVQDKTEETICIETAYDHHDEKSMTSTRGLL